MRASVTDKDLDSCVHKINTKSMESASTNQRKKAVLKLLNKHSLEDACNLCFGFYSKNLEKEINQFQLKTERELNE